MKWNKKKRNLNFEDKLKKLEEIASSIQNPNIGIDETLKLYKEGIRLSKECKKMILEIKTEEHEWSKQKIKNKAIQLFNLKSKPMSNNIPFSKSLKQQSKKKNESELIINKKMEPQNVTKIPSNEMKNTQDNDIWHSSQVPSKYQKYLTNEEWNKISPWERKELCSTLDKE